MKQQNVPEIKINYYLCTCEDKSENKNVQQHYTLS